MQSEDSFRKCLTRDPLKFSNIADERKQVSAILTSLHLPMATNRLDFLAAKLLER
jgi:hypothetical protein